MSTLEKLALPAIVCLSAVAYVMSLMMESDAFGNHWMAREDGLLEMFTFFALLTSAGICLYRGWTLRRERSTIFVATLLAGSAILAFGAGEEISWGQRMLGIESPEFFQTHNGQGETNLHNMVVAGVGVNKLIFGKLLALVLITYLVALPIGYDRSHSIRKRVDALAIPVPRLQHILVALAVVAVVETSTAGKRGEINEFAISSVVLLILLNARNRKIFDRKETATATTDAPQTVSMPVDQQRRAA